MFCYALLCFAMFCYVFVMFCYVLLCFAGLGYLARILGPVVAGYLARCRSKFDVRASGEAILGTQRYLPKAFLTKISSRLRRGDFGFWLRGGRSRLWKADLY